MNISHKYHLINVYEDYILHHVWVMFLLVLLIILLCILAFRVIRHHIKSKVKPVIDKETATETMHSNNNNEIR